MWISLFLLEYVTYRTLDTSIYIYTCI